MRLINSILIVGACFVFSHHVTAATIATRWAGSAVTSIDRSATFDGLDYIHNGTSISDYTEDSLFIGTDGDSFSGRGPAFPPYFNPFHIPMDPATQAFYFPDEGNRDWVTIQTTDSQKIIAVEFLYGNGWTTGDIYGVPWGNDNAFVEWQTLNDGVVVSSGQVGPNPLLPVGTILGFYDPDGFDQLLMKCRIAGSVIPELQALAMDNLQVQLSETPAQP
ncbi:MAG: hypothetical protein HY232_20110 [Acidobacteria bacterium]|nr:hypothetical protein [Acidobacteriota bacterium]